MGGRHRKPGGCLVHDFPPSSSGCPVGIFGVIGLTPMAMWRHRAEIRNGDIWH